MGGVGRCRLILGCLGIRVGWLDLAYVGVVLAFWYIYGFRVELLGAR